MSSAAVPVADTATSARRAIEGLVAMIDSSRRISAA